MSIHPIRNDSDYQVAMGRASYFFDHLPKQGTEEGDEFEILTTLIESYERKNFHVESADPLEATKFRMGQGGLTAEDLATD